MKYSDVELDKINAKLYKQHLLVNYEEQRLQIQTDWMKLTHYGIPRNDKYHTTEESRRYLQLPLTPDSFTQFIQSLDELFSSSAFKSTYLTDKQQSFNYMPMYKEGKADYPPSIKLKMNLDMDGNLLTQITHFTDEGQQECYLTNMDDVKRGIP